MARPLPSPHPHPCFLLLHTLLLMDYGLICLLSISPISTLKCKLHEGEDFCFFCFSSYPQGLGSAWHIVGSQGMLDESHGKNGPLIPSLGDFWPAACSLFHKRPYVVGDGSRTQRTLVMSLNSCRTDVFQGEFSNLKKKNLRKAQVLKCTPSPYASPVNRPPLI